MINFDAIKDVNKLLNAFNDFDAEAQGGEGALAGLTIGVKANIAVKNMPWTAGCEAFRDRIADRDAEAVARLRGEGAAIIGMLNMEEAALGAKTDNPYFGATQNPHKLGYSPGGSSGGSGAAVAAGLCDIALGSDTMGSVRIPSAYCGIYGFKPAQSSISQDGLEIAQADFDCIGPMARSLNLLEMAARIMSNFAENDAAGGAVATLVESGVDCELEVIENFRDTLRHVDGPIATAHLSHPFSRIRFAGFIKTSRDMAAHLAHVDQEKLSVNLRKLLSYGPKRRGEDWQEDLAILRQTATEMQEIVAKHGHIILPTAPQGAFAHDEAAPANQADFTCLANIANLPAISIPMGMNDKNMPLGVQIIGTRGCEADLFAMAAKLDEKLSAYRRPKNYLK
ncbi:hypothetical protein LPB140_01010 [Sphingorhabdus lutea]|uniref:Amidase domain-containing protein n=1 Tax=Sphingorhabdus lutea TaxID=1913578 RepID=A0A1L3J967_9SPHN|nr:amidase [Sphingorhabdus lutea]APG61651.1 hypothetical protein LPB140_01010 [Sphingorhabdus lutea]